MKISNEKHIRIRMVFLLAIIFTALAGLGFLILIINSHSNILITATLGIVLVLAILMFLRLRYFIYENSGEVLSVKYYHPMKTRPRPVLEIPQKKLLSIEIQKNIFGKKIRITIAARSGKRAFQYRVSGMKRHEAEAIKNLPKSNKNREIT